MDRTQTTARVCHGTPRGNTIRPGLVPTVIVALALTTTVRAGQPFPFDGAEFPVGYPSGTGWNNGSQCHETACCGGSCPPCGCAPCDVCCDGYDFLEPAYYASAGGCILHPGEDWNLNTGGDTDCGHSVHAVANGEIVAVPQACSWGTLVIRHDDVPVYGTLWSLYGHLSLNGPLFQVGDTVGRGEWIGDVSGTGGFACHLHLEIRTPANGVGFCSLPTNAGGGNDEDWMLARYLDPSDFISAHPPELASFSGHVLDSGTGLPMQGARVNWGNNCTVTDANGNFAFVNVACGTQNLWACLPGTPCGGTVAQACSVPFAYTPVCSGSSELPDSLDCPSGDCTEGGGGFDLNDHVQVVGTRGYGLRAWAQTCSGGYVLKYDGDTGTVVGGPSECCNGYIRWRILWDDDGSTRWSAAGDPETGETWLQEMNQPTGSPPTVSINEPHGGEVYDEVDIVVTGTASDPPGPNSGIDKVQVRVNGGGWETAEGDEQWSESVQLDPGSNLIEARSKDLDGNFSPVDQVTVTLDILPDTIDPWIGIYEPDDGEEITSATIEVSGEMNDAPYGPGGIDYVTVRVNDGPAVLASLNGDDWSAVVALELGQNEIVAEAVDDYGNEDSDSVTVTYTLPPTPVPLQITPSDGFSSSGYEGGPFTPQTKTYTLTNPNDSPLSYSFTSGATWLQPSSGSGTFFISASSDKTFTIGPSANSLPPGTHTATITFNDTTTGAVLTRPVTLTINPGSAPPTCLPSQIADLIAADPAENETFGEAVHLTLDRCIVGTRGDSGGTGAAYVFRYEPLADMWVQEAKLTRSDGVPGNSSGFGGWPLALEGEWAMVGAPGRALGAAPGVGGVYVYKRIGTVWNEVAILVPQDPTPSKNFGIAVKLDANRAIIGARGDDDNGNDAGAAYVFNYGDSEWVEGQKLLASNGAADHSFGLAVDIEGQRAVVGAPQIGPGRVYAFLWNGDVWVEEAILSSDDGAHDDEFGAAVAIDSDRIVVGAPRNDDNGSESGSAYVFMRDASGWFQQNKLLANDGSTNSRFGDSVGLDNDWVVVGSWGHLHVSPVTGFGAAYLFRWNGAAWVQEAELLDDTDSFQNEQLGKSVSIAGSRTIVGHPGGDGPPSDCGTAPIYALGSPPVIVQQPASISASAGQVALFWTTAQSSNAPAYQWRKGGQALANGGSIFGADTSTLTIDAVEPADAGQYDVVISNACGTVVSTPAELMVQSTAGVTIFGANPPAAGPFVTGQVFRDVLQTGASSLAVTQGIGAAGTPSEGPVTYSPISVTFSGTPSPVPAIGNVTVTCTGGGCPTVTGVAGTGPGPYLITLSSAIPPGHCTTLSFAGTAPGVKLQYQSQPGNLNLDALANTQDLLILIQALNNGQANMPINLARYNVNRSTGPNPVNTQDLLRLIQLLNGTNTTQAFNGATVANCP